ncbi:MAG: phosphoglucosamine mutase [Alphaproteobacteria bacterium]|nr:MAG: phosphoglucosamine mutase [Alphaproteobacteria bacterium]
MKKKLFGTDGIRGLVNHFPIEPNSLVKIASSIATHFSKGEKLKCIIGKDTRVSGYMLESALVSGLLAHDVDIVFLGPVPSPAVSMLTPALKADFGIMLTASHNAYHDNGIKIFDYRGEKLTDEAQDNIEALFANNQFLLSDKIGKATRLEDCSGRYIEFVKRTLDSEINFKDMKIVLDTANGAGYKFAPRILKELGANVITICNEPDGFNINAQCGATHLSKLSEAVLHHSADLGIALDGDADRLAVVDETGQLVSGEHIFAALLEYKNADKCVVTNVTNPGFLTYCSRNNIEAFISNVGDREVLALMREKGCKVGGEPSGHFILLDHLSSSDGMISALQILSYLIKTKKRASDLNTLFPLMNTFEKKILIEKSFSNTDINTYVTQNADIKNPYLIRKSGTENALRLYMWGESLEKESGVLISQVEEFLERLN